MLFQSKFSWAVVGIHMLALTLIKSTEGTPIPRYNINYLDDSIPFVYDSDEAPVRVNHVPRAASITTNQPTMSFNRESINFEGSEREGTPRKYNRRPISSKISSHFNVLNPTDLWNKVNKGKDNKFRINKVGTSKDEVSDTFFPDDDLLAEFLGQTVKTTTEKQPPAIYSRGSSNGSKSKEIIFSELDSLSPYTFGATAQTRKCGENQVMKDKVCQNKNKFG